MRIGATYRLVGNMDVRIERKLIRGWEVFDLRRKRLYKVRSPREIKFEVTEHAPVTDFKSRAAGERDE